LHGFTQVTNLIIPIYTPHMTTFFIFDTLSLYSKWKGYDMKKLFILLFLSISVLNCAARHITVQYAVQLAKKKFIDVCPGNEQKLTSLAQSLFEGSKNHRNNIDQQTADEIVRALIEDHFETMPAQAVVQEKSSPLCHITPAYADLAQLYPDHSEAPQKAKAIDIQKPFNVGRQYPIPAPLAQRNVFHVEAQRQHGPTCGYHAIINGWAIQELLKAGLPITSQSIAKKALEKKYLIPRNAHCLDNVEIEALNAQLKVDHLHFIACDSKTVFSIDFGNFASFEHIKNNDTACAVFISHKSGHWFLNAIIKQNGNKPYLLVLDSVNTKIRYKDASYQIAEYISDRIGN
jgi:hypothetical protein